MKNRHLLALLQSGFTTIQVEFKDSLPGRGQQSYTYKAWEDLGIEVGDEVVVDSPSKGMTVVKVVGVDKVPKIDLDVDWTYKWIVCKVDSTRYEKQKEIDEAFSEQMMEVERIHQREQLMNKFRDHLPEGSEARKAFEAATSQLVALEVKLDAE